MDLNGLAQVEYNLEQLGKVAGGRVMRASLFAASKPILDVAASQVRTFSRSDSLLIALGRTFRHTISTVPDDRGGRWRMSIGPRVKNRRAVTVHNQTYNRKRRGIFHGHFLEWGHRVGNRLTGRLRRLGVRTARSVGGAMVAAKPFMRPALDRAGQRSVAVFTLQVRRRVERALKRQDPAARDV